MKTVGFGGRVRPKAVIEDMPCESAMNRDSALYNLNWNVVKTATFT